MNRLNLPAPFYDTSEFPGNLFVITEDDLHYIGSPKAVNKSQISGNENLEEMDVSSGPESELSDDGRFIDFWVFVYLWFLSVNVLFSIFIS